MKQNLSNFEIDIGTYCKKIRDRQIQIIKEGYALSSVK
jgi:hypothetical protein